ncbi:hypothetical protein SPRG_07078 [Saprolegnia parasitica CBS 223.65]|uniref:VASt domain-containing protein n=1 Tax=Saprolegnia parasitica (strain CBS 223.65) TaxID=695850 RepID=A0A067C9N3_SAPPC|nr:hypothetical protein SPRG_07078 [Saprolegnia parasitica CBS 223.65]KDO27489.1 hypothetical protein SPRG_07078 [Saprolegnia parasitica CBS 223.65]|eukprot:XP_012201924.1 hypothetical protein SPRG_07078 [Saprolegnia parasitica CBS 223.65]
MQAGAEVVPVDSAMAVAATSPKPEPLTYDVHLFEAFPAVCAKGKNGVQTCQAMSLFLQDRANFEMLYSKQLGKIQQSPKSEDWAKQVASVWAAVHKAMASISAEHADFASKHTTSIVAGIKACTLQQDTQIQRLTSEGLKVKSRYQDYVTKANKTKERYDKKCADALELLASLSRKPDGDKSSSDLFSKVWDSTKNLAFTSQDRQRTKVAAAMDDIVAAEAAYTRAIEALASQRTVYERSLKENLRAFEVTEEQRIEYIKDLLLRTEKARLGTLKKIEAVIADMQAAIQSIDVLDDIEDGLVQGLGLQSPELTSETAWLLDTESSRLADLVAGVQSMSDQGVICTHAMLNTLVDYISAEETFVQALDKLSSIHGTPPNEKTETGLFASSYPVVADEGATFSAAWAAVVAQLQRVAYLHREFGSLLAEPVLLSLGTMKNEYDETKTALDADLGRLYGTILAERQAHGRLVARLEAKRKELDANQMTQSNNSDKEDMLHHLGLADSPSERERKLGWKVDQLRDEITDLSAQVDASAATLLGKADMFRQELQRVLSGYLKNEKYRLDVKKSSLRSLVKAHDHLVLGLKHASQAIVTDVDQLSATCDIQEFIRHVVQESPPSEAPTLVPVLSTSPVLLEQLRKHTSTSKPKLVATSSNSNLARTMDETEDSNASDADAILDKKDELKDDKDSLLFAMGSAEFQRVFNLAASEHVVATFSCALYLHNFPCQGRLYLSQTYLCFTGWRDAFVVLPLTEITHMERKNTAIVVPNALELTTATQGRFFFASFLYRDECMQSIGQLRQIQQQMQAILTPSEEVETTNGEAPETQSSLDVSEQETILSQDYDVVMDEVLSLPLAYAYKSLWEPAGYLDALLNASGETNVSVGEWSSSPVQYTAFKRPETFQKARTVTYTHNKKYMVGPSAIPTSQVQRLSYTDGVGLVLSVTATVADAPYHDYFRAESRWLLTPLANGDTRLRTGVRLFWVKSTWLKKQIEGATASESKETMKLWTVKAIEAFKKTTTTTTAKTPPTTAPSTEKPPVVAEVPKTMVPPVALKMEGRLLWGLVLLGYLLVLLSLWRLGSLQQRSVALQEEQVALLRAMLKSIADAELRDVMQHVLPPH